MYIDYRKLETVESVENKAEILHEVSRVVPLRGWLLVRRNTKEMGKII